VNCRVDPKYICRFAAAVMTAEVQRRRHQSIPEQGRWLSAVVRGHVAYYGVPTNVHTLRAFRTQLARHWYRALRRRGQRHSWDW